MVRAATAPASAAPEAAARRGSAQRLLGALERKSTAAVVAPEYVSLDDWDGEVAAATAEAAGPAVAPLRRTPSPSDRGSTKSPRFSGRMLRGGGARTPTAAFDEAESPPKLLPPPCVANPPPCPTAKPPTPAPALPPSEATVAPLTTQASTQGGGMWRRATLMSLRTKQASSHGFADVVAAAAADPILAKAPTARQLSDVTFLSSRKLHSVANAGGPAPASPSPPPPLLGGSSSAAFDATTLAQSSKDDDDDGDDDTAAAAAAERSIGRQASSALLSKLRKGSTIGSSCGALLGGARPPSRKCSLKEDSAAGEEGSEHAGGVVAVPIASAWWRQSPQPGHWLPHEVGSISESRMLHLLPSLGRSDVLRAHHRDHLTRVYPLGTRFDSSNMGANTVMGCFHAGVQMTCLNYQTFDAGQQLNRALFQLNGGCGYVLQEAVLAPPETAPPAPQFLELAVIAAQHLPKAGEERLVADAWDVFDPARVLAAQRKPPSTTSASSVYVSLELWQGAGVDEVPLSFTTSVAANNGLNPAWGERVAWRLAHPAGCVLRLQVYVKGLLKDELVGTEAIPVAALRRGYRSVQLRNARGVRLQLASLLLHIGLVDETSPSSADCA